jgi:hypothetical protein
MTSFTTEDRLSAEQEPIPFAGWMYSTTGHSLESKIAVLQDQIHAMNSEIIRLNTYVRELEAKVYGGTTK